MNNYLLPLLVKKRKIELIVIQKANQFLFFKLRDIQFLDIKNILGGATSLDSFLKAYMTSEKKRYFPYEWLNDPE